MVDGCKSQSNRASLKRTNSDSKITNTTKGKKTKNDNQINPGFEKFILSNYNSKQFLELIKSGDIKLHPKNDFTNSLKNCCDDIKKKRSILANLRKSLYSEVVEKFYSEADVYLYSNENLPNLVSDIFLLASTIVEGRLLEGIQDIIKDDDDDESNIENDEVESSDDLDNMENVSKNSQNLAGKPNKAVPIDYDFMFKEMSKIVKKNCDSIRSDVTKQISDLNKKGIENEKRMTNIETNLKEHIKKLSDRISFLEGKIENSETLVFGSEKPK